MFLAQYAALLLPCIVWVCVLALVFECAPGLSGRLGDVAYFFVWAASLPLAIIGSKPGGSWFGRACDFVGIGFVVGQVERISGTQEFTIGYAPGDPTRAPIVFPGLELGPDALAARALSLIAPLVLLPLALVLFRRFDPARSSRRSRSRLAVPAWVEKGIVALTRPALRPLVWLAPDVALGFRARPLLAAAVPLFALAALARPAAELRQVLLPMLFAVLSLALADVATRERESGTAALVFATPGRRERFVAWKLGTALVTAWLLAGIPVLRLAWSEPGAALSAAIGVSFLSVAAVALGIACGTPKAFVAGSLALWYLSLNAKASEPALDYGGWWAAATPAVQAGWALGTLGAVALALAAQRRRLRLELRSGSAPARAARPRLT